MQTFDIEITGGNGSPALIYSGLAYSKDLIDYKLGLLVASRREI